MPGLAICVCGKQYNVKDEFIGRKMKCPSCSNVVIATPLPGATPQADPVFDRDRFLLRQKVLSLNAVYAVSDESGQPLVYVQRPSHVFRALLAVTAAAVVLIATVIAFIFLAVTLTGGDKPGGGNANVIAVISIVGTVIAAAMAIFVGVRLSPKRHVYFYRDETKTSLLLDVLQDSKWQLLIATFTVRDVDSQVLALFRKNYLYNFFRKQWLVLAPNGQTVLCKALEDSIILSLLRRFLGPLFGLLRTNFIITLDEAHDHAVIGEFNRKFTLFDRYVLDMTADPGRTLDRRVALALGVMLDTGERR